MIKTSKYSYGLGLCAAIAAAAIIISPYIPVGSVAVAIVLGIIVGNLFKPGGKFAGGVKFSEKVLLGWAIALMGVKLDFSALKQLGFKSILLIACAMAVTIASALILGKLFRIKKSFALMLGIGNGICGSSAIAATKDIVGADEKEVGISIAIINFLGTVGIFLLPAICRLFGLDQINSGIYIGNTLQAVGQVAASGFSVSDIAGQTGTIVKMGRILMLIPVCVILIFAFAASKRNRTDKDKENSAKTPKIPLFIIGFAALALARAFGLIPDVAAKWIALASKYTLILAMAAIGLKITFANITGSGKAALLTGSMVFIVQIIFSGLVIFLLFRSSFEATST